MRMRPKRNREGDELKRRRKGRRLRWMQPKFKDEMNQQSWTN